MSASSLGHVVNGRWTFDASVTDCFDDMLERSIPQYETMRELVADVAARFIVRSSTPLAENVLDLGCSRGETIARLFKKVGAHARYMGLEASKPMVDAARKRFAGLISEQPHQSIVQIRESDLRTDEFTMGFEDWYRVVFSVLTLQFVPINYRQGIVADVYKSLKKGGAFVVVEKVLGESSAIDALMVERYHAEKAKHGYSDEEIRRKAMALEGVLVPVTARWNVELLERAGFRYVDCFWRWLNFAGWIAVK